MPRDEAAFRKAVLRAQQWLEETPRRVEAETLAQLRIYLQACMNNCKKYRDHIDKLNAELATLKEASPCASA